MKSLVCFHSDADIYIRHSTAYETKTCPSYQHSTRGFPSVVLPCDADVLTLSSIARN